jgi:amino acid adenylation domain-containing protein
LTLLHEKRSSDAPSIRFLPDHGTGAHGARGVSARANRTLSPEALASLSKAATQLGGDMEDVLLAGFASLVSRLTRQGVVAITVDAAELTIFRLEDEISFAEAAAQGRIRKPHPNRPGRHSEHGAHYEFRSKGEPGSIPARSGLSLTVRDEGARLELASPTGLWREETLASWLDYLGALTEAASKDITIPVHRLPLWDEAEARRFYAALNQTAVEFPGESSVPGRFAVQARRRPDATAVQSSDRRYTYRELDERSTELARHLAAAGAGAGRSVAVCMERSVDLLLALLAVLKSGACYVPLDPHNPSLRLHGILEECQPVAILSDSSVAETLTRVPKSSALPVLCVDRPWQGGERLPGLPGPMDPAGMAYTIYTSGTTGKPKGVPITHGALLNLVCSMWKRPGAAQTDRTLAVAPISFDIATMDMFLPICSGGTLYIAGREDASDPHRLAELIRRHDITFMQATPATWRMLIASGWTGKRNLKMISGGEALPRELADALLELGGELWNCYGPTETTIYSSVLKIEREPVSVSIGPPISNTSFYVVDRVGQLLPPGVPGELYIGGLGVSPGYVARQELTARRFVPDRFSTHAESSSGRLFATGDLVRLERSNRFEFFGRLDHQVKLRGFRIELGEIESVLRSHPTISDAVAVLREDLPGEPRLVAYVVAKGQMGAAALREFMAASLPEYMIPAVVVHLESFPLSASGKINRRALPVPESVPRQIAADRPLAEPASNELESKLLTIFREVLRNGEIGVTDSFFRYGGYSLLTVRLFSRIDRELGARLPISLLFDAPTVRDLARVIEKGIAPSAIVPIRPYGQRAPLFLVQSYLLYDAMLEIVEQERPIYGVREMGDEREPMPMEERARVFAEEILKICPNGPLFLAGWCAAGTLTVEIARYLHSNGHPVGLVALFDSERPGFALPRGWKPWAMRFKNKAEFHLKRLRRIPLREKVTYLSEAMARNWDWAVESYYSANYRSMLWLKRRFGLSLSEAAFNNVYASLSAIGDLSVQPYPGKLSLFRAADVPSFAELDPTLGWSAISEDVEVNFVPGDHVSMFKKPHNVSLTERLQRELHEFEATAVLH